MITFNTLENKTYFVLLLLLLLLLLLSYNFIKAHVYNVA